jgi:hypothetical protein
VTVEYYERTGDAVARLSWAAAAGPGPCSSGQYRAEYFSGTTLSGTAVVTQCETVLGYDWGAGGPENGVGPDDFSVRWSGQFDFAGGSTTFTATADDGIRVWVDGVLLIDAWVDQSPTTYQATRALTSGSHAVTVEYYERTGDAVARLSWAAAAGPGPCSSGQYRAEYFNNLTLTGPPALTRCETAIAYDWGAAGPGSGVGTDNFSVRWTGRFTFPAGRTRLTATADDGIRVWVDGTPIIDAWRDQSATTYRQNVTLAAGEHEVRVEYYERTGDAVVQVGW